MQSGDVAHQVVEAVARDLSRRVEVDAVESLHDVGVIGHLKIGHDRLAEALDLHVLAVVLADGDFLADDLRNLHHDLGDLGGQLCLLCFQLLELFRLTVDLVFQRHAFLALALRHQLADLLGDLVAVGAQVVCLLLCRAALRVQRDHLVDERQLAVLKFLFDVLFYRVGIFS